MTLVTDQNNLFNFVLQVAWKGQYAASTGTEDFTSHFAATGISYLPTVSADNFCTPGKLTHGFNTYFKMQGFNNTTQRYEVWFSTGSPLLVPPSGNTLSNIEVVLTWTDR